MKAGQAATAAAGIPDGPLINMHKMFMAKPTIKVMCTRSDKESQNACSLEWATTRDATTFVDD